MELGRSFVELVKNTVKTIGSLLFSLIGGPADLIGNAMQVWDPARLRGAGRRAQPLHAHRRRQGRGPRPGAPARSGAPVGWCSARAVERLLDRLETLFCERESDWVRGTTDDEQFLLALVVNQAPGEVLRHRTSRSPTWMPGRSRTIGFTFPNVRVPDDVGYLTLPIQLLESDGGARLAPR